MPDADTGLIVDEADGVLRLTLDRPARRNAMDASLIAALTDTFRGVSQRSCVRAVVLSGTGDKAFCAGADLSPGAATFAVDPARPGTDIATLFRAGRAVPVPVVGRINGHCLAGGMGLLAVCDMAVAASHATFGLPEVKVGLFPMQVAALLRPLIPARKFAEMCFTGAPISADEALALGLVNEVAGSGRLDAAVDGLVARIVDKSPTAIRRGKHALWATSGMSFDQAMGFMEAEMSVLPLTEDAREGMAAFAGKRPPVWTGR